MSTDLVRCRAGPLLLVQCAFDLSARMTTAASVQCGSFPVSGFNPWTEGVWSGLT